MPLTVRALSFGMAVVASGALLGGCAGAPNSLSGSLDEVAPLHVDTTQVRASPEVLVVEYDAFPQGDRDGGASGGTDVVFKLVVDIGGLQLNKDLAIDLASVLPDGTPRVTASRAVGQDPRRDLPRIKRGQLVLESDVNVGQVASGNFHLLFAEGGQVGEGRTVEGHFQAPVADANPGAQP